MDGCKCPVSGLPPREAHPRVRSNYVTEDQARSLGLATAFGSDFILRADSITTLSPSGPGRNSVRITSNKQYGTHVAV